MLDSPNITSQYRTTLMFVTGDMHIIFAGICVNRVHRKYSVATMPLVYINKNLVRYFTYFSYIFYHTKYKNTYSIRLYCPHISITGRKFKGTDVEGLVIT
jgi:hypothetical protein